MFVLTRPVFSASSSAPLGHVSESVRARRLGVAVPGQEGAQLVGAERTVTGFGSCFALVAIIRH